MYRVVIPFTFDRLYEVGEVLETLPPDGLPLWISMGLVEQFEPESAPPPYQKPALPQLEDER